MTSNDYVAPSLWLDLYRSLVAATNFIYITGWSVYTDMKLLRYVLNLFLDNLFHFTVVKLKFRKFHKFEFEFEFTIFHTIMHDILLEHNYYIRLEGVQSLVQTLVILWPRNVILRWFKIGIIYTATNLILPSFLRYRRNKAIVVTVIFQNAAKKWSEQIKKHWFEY